MGQAHRCDQIELQDRLVLGPCHGIELALRVAAGVVYEHVDATEFAFSGWDQGIDAFRYGQVRRQSNDVCAPHL